MNIPTLSSRLLACCAYVRPGARIADIGCDHGYLSIYLLLQGIADSIIAADVNQMPLDSAKRNAKLYGISDKISFYLSDGVQSIPRDFDTMVCAGMGADTMISILDAAPWLQDTQYTLILQCQSKRPELRKYLYDHGFSILRETLAQDGKFIYPVMEVTYAPSVSLTPGGYHISPALIESGSPLLPAFYQRVVEGLQTTVNGLARTGGDKYEYYNAVLRELLELEDSIYGNGC
ncbi:MAG: SAM-dependent methyltransferase [Oscillospiraceae bacterium]|nr:SAM-dependent methyltransferase [Oscillospiraceae bacterium]